MTTPPPHLPAPVANDPESPPVRRSGLSRWPLLWTILGAVGLGGGATVATYWLLGRAVVIDYAEGLTGAQRLTAAFATATAIGAIVALVVNVRKQDLAERTAAQAEAQYAETIFRDREAAFTDRFRAASQQLGATTPPERIAGVYAMAALADDYADRRQQCVDVLCGYLRLRWDPDLDDLAATSTTITETDSDGVATSRTTTPVRRPHDAEVRATIVAVIAAHTRVPADPATWTPLNFNLASAHLVDVDFDDCHFAGEVAFSGATFSGTGTSFMGTTFSGVSTSFMGTTFSGKFTNFDGATFSGMRATFNDATFSAGFTSLVESDFSARFTTFSRVMFSGKYTSFNKSRFSGESTSFNGATFSGERATFNETTFDGQTTSFARVTFSGANTRFVGARFLGASTSFAGARFLGANTNFDEATFSCPAISFAEALVPAGTMLRLSGLADPNSVCDTLKVEGGRVLHDGQPCPSPAPPPSGEESP